MAYQFCEISKYSNGENLPLLLLEYTKAERYSILQRKIQLVTCSKEI